MKKYTAVLISVLMLALALSGCATAGAEGEAATISPVFTIIYLVVIVAVMYFLMIRPERKRRKEAEELRSSITVGDTVTTIGGIVGKVVDMKDDFITIETSEDRVRIELAKWGVSTVGKQKESDEDNTSK